MTPKGRGVDSQSALEAALLALDASAASAQVAPAASSPVAPHLSAAAEPPTKAVPAEPSIAPPPVVWVTERRFDAEVGMRERILATKDGNWALRKELQRESKQLSKDDPERFQLAKQIQATLDDDARLEGLLAGCYVPQHGPSQLITTQHIAMSRLFNIRGKTEPRLGECTFESHSPQHGTFTYMGPELRQSDGLVFMALVNMARDIRVGTLVSFDPSEMCHWLYGRYDGPQRSRLKDAIHRLQRALLTFSTFAVQLAQRFNFPARGRWTVMLDPEIVAMFKQSPLVWIDIETRRSLPEGLTTWLYCYVKAQTTLIPQRLELLREMCGSDACEPRSFETTLSRAMKNLVEAGVVDGWRIKQGALHWRKAQPALADSMQ